MVGRRAFAIALTIAIFGFVDSFRVRGWVRPYIIGGKPADISDFKYQVSLWKKGEGLACGASALSETYALSAAHCIKWPNVPDIYYLRANSASLFAGEKFNIQKLWVHDKFSENNPFQYDVAIIRLADPGFDFARNENIKPIALVPESKEPGEDASVVVSGWGRTKVEDTNFDEDYSEILMKLELNIVDRKSCDKCLGNRKRITSRVICAGLMDSPSKKDASLGDSGGPLVDQTSGLQVGIVSFGDERPKSKCPGVYTNLADPEVQHFIKTVMNQ